MKNDLSFITNQNGHNLKERFKMLIKDTTFFDCLVGYFYTSGFQSIYKSLEPTEKIRILVGINTDQQTYENLYAIKNNDNIHQIKSHLEVKKEYQKMLTNELENSEDSISVESGIEKFIEWINAEKLEIRAYPSQNIHAKLYIMTFHEDDRDEGRVITGSSNFTKSGFIDNLEFNVELTKPSDYYYAKEKFEELWKDSVDLTDKYINTIRNKTWLREDITPYELYIKFLYEYFRDELNTEEDIQLSYIPEQFMKLEYQEQAVLNAKKILLEYGGVFISDVVGLGKTFVSAMLASQIDGRTLVIAPPVLLERSNPGSWNNVFSDFRIPADFYSLGKLDKILKNNPKKYKNVIIDEAHRFRNENTQSYEKLSRICRGKRIILVSATPYNNSPKDILSLLKLFQNVKKSTIPNLPDLEDFFSNIESRLQNIDRRKDYKKYIETVKKNSLEIRDKVLKYLMVRRTRNEIVKYFNDDIKKQGLKFPEVEKPQQLYYQLNEEEDKAFSETIEKLTKEFKYARYTPLLFLKKGVNVLEKQSQRNMGKFMKILLVKRLESSFHAFKQSLDRFIKSYKMFIKQYENGKVYISKKYSSKIFEILEKEDDKTLELLGELVEAGKAKEFNSYNFTSAFIEDLENDLKVLNDIQKLWKKVNRDPKIEKLKKEMRENPILKKNHVLIFTESKETAVYLSKNLNEEKTMLFTGDSKESEREELIANFDANSSHKKNEYRILISTEVLSEGVNLHRGNVVINYDIPWNPTRMMQRVGRINRVDTPHEKIYTFNFFPTSQSNEQIKLEEAAKGKINAFFTLLGGDAELLTEGEPIDSHELFDRLTSKTILEEEEENSELKYLKIIKDIRENNAELFEKIKKLPKKARTGKESELVKDSLITFFRKGKIKKFFIADEKSKELDFISAADLLKCNEQTNREKIPKEYYQLLKDNKLNFDYYTAEEVIGTTSARRNSNASKVIGYLRVQDTKKMTEEQEEYIQTIIKKIEEGNIPNRTIKNVKEALEKLGEELSNSLKVIGVLKSKIPEEILQEHYSDSRGNSNYQREIILSMFLTGDKNE